MSFPASLTTRTVKGRFVTYPGGIAARGKVRIVLNNFMQGPTDDVFVAPFDETIKLDNNGSFSVVLPATNDPQWTSSYYKVTITADDQVVRSRFDVPYNSTDPIDLADVLNLPPVTPGESYILAASMGIPGGIAVLDENGIVFTSQLPPGNGGDISWDDILDKPTEFPHDEVAYADVTGKPTLFPPVAHDHPMSNITDLADALALKADLVGGVLDESQVPMISINDYLGEISSQVAMLALVGQKGDWCIRTDLGLRFDITGSDPTQLSSWTSTPVPAVPVQSVNGETGDVVLDKADVGLGNVDDVADISKPISIAQQAALDLKAPLASPTFTGTVSGVTAAMVGLGNANNTSDTAKPISTAQQTALDLKADAAAVSTALSSKADLVGGFLATSQIPALSINETFTVASQAAMLALTAQRGDVAVRSDFTPYRVFFLASDSPSTLADWKEITAAGSVVTVNGQSGVVVLAKSDIGLGNIDNTADTAKPVSTAQQAALDAKVSILASVSAKTANYTLTANDVTVTFDATSAALTATLPTAVGVSGKSYLIKRKNTNNNNVTVATTSSQTIDYGSVYALTTPQAFVRVQSDGANWLVVDRSDQSYINVKDFGARGDGVTDDTAAIQSAFDAIPIASGNEIGGGCIFFPKGIYLVNQSTSGISLKLTSKPNVTLKGVGDSTRIRVTTGDIDELIRMETCTAFHMQDMLIQVIGTGRVGKAIHHTTLTDVGSSHYSRFTNVGVSCNGTYRRAWDVMCTSGSPTVYSAMAAFAAGDVGGSLMVNLTGGPWTSNITAVATLSGTLAADVSTTTATTVTLSSAISGAPVSGFTIKIDTERMFVSAGGNTTTLTVTRGRGADGIKTTHTAGATVVTYSATLDSNAPSTITNAAAPCRIQPSGTAIVQTGLAIGTDHPGSPDLDIAGTMLVGYWAGGCQTSGLKIGNSVSADILDQWAYGLSIAECGIAVHMDGGAISIHGGEFSTNVVDIKRNVQVSQDVVIDGIRTEGPSTFYEMTGSASGGPPTRISTVNVATFNDEAGVVIRHENAGSLILESIHLKSSTVNAGNVLIAVNGSSPTNPCYLTAINVASTGGNADPFTSSIYCVKTILGSPRHSVGGTVSRNTVVGAHFDDRVRLNGGLILARTPIVDTNYTILTSDITIAYTTLTAARVVTLPAQANTLPVGQEFTIKDETGSCDSTKTITITPPSGTIDGAATFVLSAPYAKVTIYTNGTNWYTRTTHRNDLGIINVTDSRWGTDPFGTNPLAALAAATTGQTVYFPPGTYTNPTGVGSGYTIVADDVRVLASGVTINVSTWGQAGIDCFNRSGIVIQGPLTVTYTGTRGNHLGTAYRGSAPYANGCGIYINRDRCRIDKLRTIGMPVGIFLSSYNGTSSGDRTGVGNIITNLEVEGFDFGVLWVGQEGLGINGIYGHDDTDDSSGANATHIYYCSGADTLPTTNLTISNARAKNVIYGQPYQLRFVRGGSISAHSAVGCKGLINIASCEDLVVTGLSGKDILANSGQGAITTQTSGSSQVKRLSISDVTLSMATNVDELMVRFHGDDITASDMTLYSSRPTTPVGSSWEYITSGAVHTHRGIKIMSRGAGHVRAMLLGVSGFTSSEHTVENISCESTIGMVDVYPSNTATISYNPAAQRSILSGSNYIGLGAAGTAEIRVSRDEYERLVTVSSSATTPTPNPWLETRTLLNVTDSSNFTISAPAGSTTPPLGTTLDIIVANSSGGTLGTVTWNAAYSLATPFVAPPSGGITMRRFRHNGSNWAEITQRPTVRITTTTSSATPTPNIASTDIYELSALAAGATFGAPTGVAFDGQSLVYRVKDNGGAQTLAWNAVYRAVGTILPTTTAAGKQMYVGCRYNSTAAKWDVLAVVIEI